MKELLNSFNLNAHTLGFHSHTLDPSHIQPKSCLA